MVRCAVRVETATEDPLESGLTAEWYRSYFDFHKLIGLCVYAIQNTPNWYRGDKPASLSRAFSNDSPPY